jgi:hypothetical protein
MHPVTLTVEQVVEVMHVTESQLDTGAQVVNAVQADVSEDETPSYIHDGVHVVTGTHSVTSDDVYELYSHDEVHVVTGVHAVRGSHTVAEDWHGGGLGGHMAQFVVVITCVVVVQLVEQGTVEVTNTVTVPMTYAEVHVVQDCCESSTVAEGVQRPLLLRECVSVVSSSYVESAGAWAVASKVLTTTYRKKRPTY